MIFVSLYAYKGVQWLRMDVQIVHYCWERCQLCGKSILGKECLCHSVCQCYHDPYELFWASPVRLQTASCAYGAEYGSNCTPNTTVWISSQALLFKRSGAVLEYIILSSWVVEKKGLSELAVRILYESIMELPDNSHFLKFNLEAEIFLWCSFCHLLRLLMWNPLTFSFIFVKPFHFSS